MNYFEMEPMRYWALPSGLTPQEQRSKITERITNYRYLYSLKTDGNWSRAVITPERSALQTRGVSKKTGTFGEVQDRVFWWDDVVKAFSSDTVILGEIFLPNGIDKNVGSVLRSLPLKSKSIQSRDYFLSYGIQNLSKKDKKEVEENEFFNIPLHWRIFDVLVYEGKDLMSEGIEERSAYIEKAVRKINSPLVKGVKYFPADYTFFDRLNQVFGAGGEGVVLYQEGIPYVAGKRGPSAYNTIKCKQTLENEVDCFVYGVEPAIREYTGKDVENWMYWENIKTGEKLYGLYYNEYIDGVLNLEPITKGYYNEWAGAILCAVYDEEHKPYIICKCSGLTDAEKEDIKKNYSANWHMRPLCISGMMISQGKDKLDFSVRHPVIKAWRDGDISVDDCLLSKVIAQS